MANPRAFLFQTATNVGIERASMIDWPSITVIGVAEVKSDRLMRKPVTTISSWTLSAASFDSAAIAGVTGRERTDSSDNDASAVPHLPGT